MPRFAAALALIAFAAAPHLAAHAEDAMPKPRPPITPPWALECWLWEDDHNDSKTILELLDGYKANDIPARTVILDAPWANRYNDFKICEEQYPEPAKFFAELDRRGIRKALWMTPMVNAESNDCCVKDSKDFYEEAKAKGYLAGGGYLQKWWHGEGGFIDYANPEAMKWWRGMQQQVFDWGIDGWKMDGMDLYFNSPVGLAAGVKDIAPLAERKSWMTTREYMDHFARDEYQHGLKQRKGDFITLIRSIDGRVHPEGFAPLDAAPVTWVGDQDHAWLAKDEGIEEALNDILESARVGYCVIGSDVAGYHGKEPIPPRLYIRWAQFSAFCGLFLNGGHGERAMWKRTPEELEIVRKFAWLHDEMVPYMYTYVVDCHNGAPPLMRPLGKSKRGADQGDFHYFFGDAFLVAPIHEDSPRRTVKLPEGGWRYFFNDAELHAGPKEVEHDYPLEEAPVFVRGGSLFPMLVSRPYTGLGDRDSEGFMTWIIYPAEGGNKFTLHQTDGSGDTTVAYERAGAELKISVSGAKQAHILRVNSDKEPKSVALDGKPLAKGASWSYNAEARKVIVKTKQYGEGKYELTF